MLTLDCLGIAANLCVSNYWALIRVSDRAKRVWDFDQNIFRNTFQLLQQIYSKRCSLFILGFRSTSISCYNSGRSNINRCVWPRRLIVLSNSKDEEISRNALAFAHVLLIFLVLFLEPHFLQHVSFYHFYSLARPLSSHILHSWYSWCRGTPVHIYIQYSFAYMFFSFLMTLTRWPIST